MIKVGGLGVLIGISSLLIGGCASQQVIDAGRINLAQKTLKAENNVSIHCSGAMKCEFERLNNQTIVDASSHRVDRKAIERGWVRLKNNSFKDNGLYLNVPPSQYEVIVRYYPISEQRAEMFHIIHNFKAHQNYTLKMYRKRFTTPGSLLNVSAPTPLCVDLLLEQRPIRRFCRPYNVLTGVSEFIEQRI
ncbi:hypothetical protein [Acinetobacter stercoris]|uniref:Lipoprotein n=1 Tax=Acinetobacter stercoris TaxID=2126983 RepID=A0A2U3N442_9GAMM|nr:MULTISPECIES: hypothetical protein [Acinetobacter]SPL72329.1 hypothetical protein KPC_3507 [Acinetobacter stercoris]